MSNQSQKTETQTASTPQATFSELAGSYDAFLFDAYGVLVNEAGAIPAAVAAVEWLARMNKPYFIVTNDASKTVEEAVTRYSGYGFPVTAKNVVSSGMLVTDYFVEQGLHGAGALVLGREDAFSYVTDGGGEILPFSDDAEPDIVVLLDDKNHLPAERSLSVLITVLFRCIEGGKVPHLLLANPDLVYPVHGNAFSMAVGSIALMLEHIIALRFPGSEAPRFIKTGKPFLPIFNKVLSQIPGKRAIMLGDQLATDIAGAKTAAIDSAIVLGGITAESTLRSAPTEMCPTYMVRSLSLARG